MAYQTADVVAAMEREAGITLTELRVDGGASANDLAMQFQADALGVSVVRPACIETTAAGRGVPRRAAGRFFGRTSTRSRANGAKTCASCRRWTARGARSCSLAGGTRSNAAAAGRARLNRDVGLSRLAEETFDVVVVGGGATGLGAAVDAASRGYHTALIDAGDFASATSTVPPSSCTAACATCNRATSVWFARPCASALGCAGTRPHLVRDLAFVVPAYRRFDLAFYALGLTAYDALAGRTEFPRSRVVSPAEARALIPGLAPSGLRGAVVYHDGQFDDARLALALARTAVDHGAAVANYVRATRFVYDGTGRAVGVGAVDAESGAELVIAGAR